MPRRAVSNPVTWTSRALVIVQLQNRSQVQANDVARRREVCKDLLRDSTAVS